MPSHYLWYLAGWLVFLIVIILFFRGATMINITDLQKEVQDELAQDMLAKAKSQLKSIERDIINAKQLVDNLERKKKDLLVAISEGTN